MSHSTSGSLGRFVHKTLLQRLTLMTLAIMLAVGVMAYLSEQRRTRDYVREEASNAIDQLVARARVIADERYLAIYPAFRQALAERTNNPLQRRSGDFVFAGFFEPQGTLIAEVRDSEHHDIDRVKSTIMGMVPRTPSDDQTIAENAEVNDQPYVYVVVPVKDHDGHLRAYAHAIFALSEAARTDIANRIWRFVGVALLIVIATAGLLYPVIFRLVNRLSRFSNSLLEANLESLALLGGAIAKRDGDTDAHNYRVTIYSAKLAETIGLSTQQMRALIKGAFLHDVGKIGIRDNILLKPGRLDEDEREIMKTHVNHGLDVVGRSVWLEDAAQVVGSHHEKYDGSGYPVARKGEEIPVAARLFAIVDVFDALTSKRPYKEPMSFERTMEIIRQGSGSHFDPDLVAAFERIAEQFYLEYCGREDEGLHEELDKIVRRYFNTEMQTLI